MLSKEATVHHYFYETHQELREYLKTYLAAYNFAKRLKALKWQEQPGRFSNNPYHLTLGLYT